MSSLCIKLLECAYISTNVSHYKLIKIAYNYADIRCPIPPFYNFRMEGMFPSSGVGDPYVSILDPMQY